MRMLNQAVEDAAAFGAFRDELMKRSAVVAQRTSAENRKERRARERAERKAAIKAQKKAKA